MLTPIPVVAAAVAPHVEAETKAERSYAKSKSRWSNESRRRKEKAKLMLDPYCAVCGIELVDDHTRPNHAHLVMTEGVVTGDLSCVGCVHTVKQRQQKMRAAR